MILLLVVCVDLNCVFSLEYIYCGGEVIIWDVINKYVDMLI